MKWEYFIVNIIVLDIPRTKDELQKWLDNEIGSQGWELAAVDDIYYIFKRPIKE